MSMKCATRAAVPFIQIPKFLFHAEFASISLIAKLLYSLLRDRLELSKKNKWADKQGNPYLIYTRDDLCQILGYSQPTVRKAIKQLKDAGLMTEKRQGLTKPNLIYLAEPHSIRSKSPVVQEAEPPKPHETSDPVLEEQGAGREPSPLAPKAEDSFIQESNFSSFIYKEDNKTDSNQTDNQSIRSGEKRKKTPVRQEEYEDCKALLKENIGYNVLIRDNKCTSQELDEILDIMTDAMCSPRETIRVNRENKPAEVVKNQFLKLDNFHIEYVFDCLSRNTTRISNIRAYLLSALYNAPSTILSYYRAAVSRDRLAGVGIASGCSYNLNDPRMYDIFHRV